MRASFLGKKEQLGEGVYILNWSYLAWFFITALVGSISMFATQQEQGLIYTAAQLQLITGLVGLLGGLALAGMGIVQIRRDTTDDIMTYLAFGAVGFGLASIASNIVSRITRLSGVFWHNFTIVFSAAVTEEALFSLALSTMLFYFTKPFFDKYFGEELGNIFAIIFTASVVSYAFAAFHIGAYGTDFSTMLYLATSRFVYTIIYLASRNVLAPFYSHAFHNVLLLVLMGV